MTSRGVFITHHEDDRCSSHVSNEFMTFPGNIMTASRNYIFSLLHDRPSKFYDTLSRYYDIWLYKSVFKSGLATNSWHYDWILWHLNGIIWHPSSEGFLWYPGKFLCQLNRYLWHTIIYKAYQMRFSRLAMTSRGHFIISSAILWLLDIVNGPGITFGKNHDNWSVFYDIKTGLFDILLS